MCPFLQKHRSDIAGCKMPPPPAINVIHTYSFADGKLPRAIRGEIPTCGKVETSLDCSQLQAATIVNPTTHPSCRLGDQVPSVLTTWTLTNRQRRCVVLRARALAASAYHAAAIGWKRRPDRTPGFHNFIMSLLVSLTQHTWLRTNEPRLQNTLQKKNPLRFWRRQLSQPH